MKPTPIEPLKRPCGCAREFMIRDFCVQQFPFIAEDFDALTTYELLSKVICYLKELGAYTQELADKFNQLLEYVDNYFDNLDVEGILQDIIEAMYEDGRLADLVTKKLNKLIYVNNWGAKGDGETDDTEAIQYCIDNAGDGTYIFYGTYIVSDTINLGSNKYNFGGSVFKWVGDPNKPMFTIRSSSGKVKPQIIGGRIEGQNRLDYGLDVFPYHVLVDGLYTVDIKKAHIRIGVDEAGDSSQAMISNCTLQNSKDRSLPNAVGGSDVSSAIGIDIRDNDNFIINTNILALHTAVKISRSGNLFTNCHFTASYSDVGETLKPCTAVDIDMISYNTWYFNNFENCYFDNWTTVFKVTNDNDNTGRHRIQVNGGTYFNSGRQFTSDEFQHAYMLKGCCPVTITGFSQTGSPRVVLHDPYEENGRTRLYQELSEVKWTPYSRNTQHPDAVDMVGDMSLLADDEWRFVDLADNMAPGKTGELGIVCAYNYSTFNQLSGAMFEVSDRNVMNGLYKIIVNSNGQLVCRPVWEDQTSNDFCIGVYGVGQGTTPGGLPFVYYKIGFVVDGSKEISTHYSNLKVTPVKSNKMHVYLNNEGFCKIINTPEDIVKLRSV